MHKARKRFGQNFLVDLTRLQEVVSIINATDKDKFLEIGPGTGALTRMILPSKADLTAIELDRDLIPLLRSEFINYHNFHLIEGDALKYDYSSMLNANKLRIVGNLPYNIATNLIFNFWHMQNIIDMHFMLQKEVALRLTAKLGDSAYGRLSILSEYFGTADIIMDFPPESFSPAPKVDSAFIRLVPRQNIANNLQQAKNLSNALRISFAQRRKTLANNLKNHLSITQLEQMDINPKLRPQNLNLQQYLLIGNELAKLEKSGG